MKKAERMHNCMQTDWNNNKTEYKLMFTCISARTQKWYTSWLKKQQIKQIQNGTHADWNYLKKKNVLWGNGLFTPEMQCLFNFGKISECNSTHYQTVKEKRYHRTISIDAEKAYDKT